MNTDLSKQFSLINLPSEGIYYPNHKKSLFLRYITAIEEYVLCDGMLNETGLSINMVLDNLIIDNDIRARDLILSDLQALLIFLRSTSYGDDVEMTFKCPHCQKESKQNIKLSGLEWKKQEYIPDEDGLFYVELPSSKSDMVIKPVFLRDILDDNEEEDYFIIKDLDGPIKVKRTLISKLAHSVKSINGDIIDRKQVKEFLRKLPRSDVALLKEFLSKNEVGVVEEYDFSCEFCGEMSKNKIEFGYNFLSLPEEYKKNVMEELFLITYYGKGISMDNANEMPVFQRRWHLNRIKEELDKKNKAETTAVNKAKSQAKSSSRK